MAQRNLGRKGTWLPKQLRREIARESGVRFYSGRDSNDGFDGLQDFQIRF